MSAFLVNPATNGDMMIETRLDDLLEQRGRSLYWLQKESGISYTALLKLRKGRANSITFPVLEAICDLLDCQPGDLLVKVPDQKKSKR